MFSKVRGDPDIKDCPETEYCVRGGKYLIEKNRKLKHNNQK